MEDASYARFSAKHPDKVEQPKYDLFQLLLANDHGQIMKGKSTVWEKHYHQQQQQPTRPQIGRRIGSHVGVSAKSPISPRQLVSTTPTKQRASLAFSPVSSPASTPRCKSAGMAKTVNLARPSCTRPLDTSIVPRKDEASSTPRKPSSMATCRDQGHRRGTLHVSADDPRVAATDAGAPVSVSLDVDLQSREHVEIKTCMLAYMHRINVDDLQKVREQSQREIERLKLQKFVNQAGVLDDGSVLESAKRKTSFLLRHFFSLEAQYVCSSVC